MLAKQKQMNDVLQTDVDALDKDLFVVLQLEFMERTSDCELDSM